MFGWEHIMRHTPRLGTRTGIALLSVGLLTTGPATPQFAGPGTPTQPRAVTLTAGPAALGVNLAGDAVAGVAASPAAFAPLSFPLMTLNVGQIVDTLGFGSTTINDLLDQTGFGDTSLATLAAQLLDALGVGNPTITGLLDQFGVGQESVAGVLIQLLGFAGIDNPTVADLLDQAGAGNLSLAGLLIQVLDSAGIDNPTISGLLDQAGLYDQSLADVAISLLGSSDIGNPSIVGLLEQLGLSPDLTLGGLLNTLVSSQFGSDVTVTALFDQLGGGSLTVGALINLALDAIPFTKGGPPLGSLSLVDIVNQLSPFPPPNDQPVGGMTLEQLVINVLQSQDMDKTPAQLIADDPTLANTTLGDLLTQVPATDPQYASLAEEPMTVFLASDMAGGVGGENLKQLANGALDGWGACTGLSILYGLSCDQSLNSLMGSNSVGVTFSRLFSSTDSSYDPSVHAGTPAADLTVANLINGTGQFANTPLSQIITGLNLHTPTLADLMTNLGLGTNLSTLLANAFPGLYAAPVLPVLGDWGMNNIPVSTAIDNLGLDVPVVTLLSRLGLDNVYLDSVLQTMLGGVTVGSIADSLGLDDVHLNDVLTGLLGGITVNDIAGDLGVAGVHLNDVLDNLLGGVSINSIATDLGLDNVHLDSVIHDMLGGVTISDVVGDLGFGNTDINTLLSSLGLLDTDVLTVSLEFNGLMPNIVVGLPDQAATAAGWPFAELFAQLGAFLANLF